MTRWLILCAALLTACATSGDETPVQTSVAETVAAKSRAEETKAALTAMAPTATPIPTDTPAPTATNTADPTTFGIRILLHPELPEDGPEVLAAWLVYATARSTWVTNNLTRAEVEEGLHDPLYEEEVAGREALAKAWRDMDERPENQYLDELLMIFEAGFLREYVWDVLRRVEWEQPEDDLRSFEFRAWIKINLPEHQPETRAGLEIDFDLEEEGLRGW